MNLTISRRVSGGFALLLALTVVLGGLSAWWMHSAALSARFLSTAVAPEAAAATHLAEASARAQLAARTYGLTGDPASLQTTQKSLTELDEALAACRRLAQEHPELTALAQQVADAETALAAYRKAFEATRANLTELATLRTELDRQHQEFLTNITSYIQHQDEALTKDIEASSAPEKLAERHHKLQFGNDIIDAGNAVALANYRSQALRDPQIVAGALSKFDVIEERITALLKITTQDVNRQELGVVAESARKYRAGIDQIARNSADGKTIQETRAKAAGQLDTLTNSALDQSIALTMQQTDQSSTTLRRTSTFVLIGLVIALILGPVTAWLIVRGLNRALRDTSSGLTQGAVQIASASSQVSSTSQSLAQGASEQAASLEEISSSLEELASTTKHNAENATAAKAAADAARDTAEQGAGEMEKMQQAMAGIRQSSADISQIIKTIDEIAFQTNILALNAAVEAARAGEAGAGFAVVADEVRNLAQRCAVAAKETTEKISDAASRSEAGVSLSATVTTNLQEIVAKSREVDRLVAEVANASREQSAGIEQVNTAVSQMDKVTQSNAASAEEAASAAEELNAQSVEMRHAADSLAALVGLAQSDLSAPSLRPVKPVIEGVQVHRAPPAPTKSPVVAAHDPADRHFR
jgi:chromosome segregation ATPase